MPERGLKPEPKALVASQSVKVVEAWHRPQLLRNNRTGCGGKHGEFWWRRGGRGGPAAVGSYSAGHTSL